MSQPSTEADCAKPDSAETAEAKLYHRRKLTIGLLSLGIGMLAIAGLALFAGPRLDRILRDLVGDNRWLRLSAVALVCAAALEILNVPFDFWSGFVLEHRYGLSNQSVRGWIWKRLKGYLIGGPLGLAMVCGLYTLLWWSGPWWWLWATAAWLAVTLVLGRLLPILILPLFYKVTPLENVELLERLRRIAQGTGLGIEGVFRLHLSAETKKANAALAGLGRSRRVLLGDTLLDEFTAEEIEVVFAHEVGHHVHRHIVKMIAGNVLTSAAGFWLCDVVLRRSAVALGYARFDDPAALPLLLLILSLFGLLLSPLQNGLSRLFEVQADRYALDRTAAPAAFRSAFGKLARLNKADLDPHPVVVWLFEDHPPIRERIAMADKR